MITLYTFGPAFGLPDPSPFVTKAEVLLKMAGLAYQTDLTGFRRAPKGKLPYIDDDGERIADSTFIRWHLEKKYGVDFERGLSVEAGTLCPHFKTPLRTAAERHPNLGRYVGRMTARYYPDRGEIAGCKAAA